MKTAQPQAPKKPQSPPLKRRKGIRKPGTRRPLGVRVAIILAITAVILGGFKLLMCLNVTTPQFHYMNVAKNGEALVLLDGETIRLHPGDKLGIKDISTNVCFNRGVRIASSGFDADSLLYGEVLLSDILPEKEVYSNHTFRLEVKNYNQPMGYVELVVEPLMEDWIKKADTAVETENKIEILKQAAAAFPEERQIKERLASEYVSQENWEEAARVLEGIVKDKPDNETCRTLLGVYEKMSNNMGIISVLNSMLELTPDETDLKIKLAEALAASGRTAEAVGIYEGLLMSMKGEGTLPVHTNLGYLYAKTGENEKAISSYLKALELDKNDANIYHNLSLLYDKTGQKKKASQYLSKAVALKPESIDDKLKLAENQFEAGDIKEAEKTVKDFIRDNPGSADAWLLLMRIAEKNGDKKALKAVYQKILEINPQDKNAVYNLGVMEYEGGDQDKALSYFERYIKSSPDDGAARSFLFEIYRSRKKDDMAFREASAVTILKPDQTECTKYVFEYLSKKERYSEIASLMEEAIKVAPKEVNIRRYLVTAYLKTGKEGQAVNQMKAVIELDPKDTETLMQLARLYERQNRPNDALDAYKKILDADPDNEDAETTYLRLRVKTIPNK